MIKDGNAYLVYLLQSQTIFEPGEGVQFVAIPRNGITILEVPEKYHASLINKRCGCCGAERRCFRDATEAEVKVWRGN